MVRYLCSIMLTLLLCASALAGDAAPSPHSKHALAKYSKQTLLTLCHNLYQKVDTVTADLKAATGKLSQIRASKKDPITLQKQLARLQQQIKSLTAENTLLKHQLKQSGQMNKDLLAMTANKANGNVHEHAHKAARHGDHYVPPYRYSYSLRLIGENHVGYFVIRHSNGTFTHDSYNWADYDHNHINFHGYFRNNGNKPYRFQFEIRVAKRTLHMGISTGPPPLAGSAMYKTRVLLPGEVAIINKAIAVPNPQQIGEAAIGNVQAFPVAQPMAPGSGQRS